MLSDSELLNIILKRSDLLTNCPLCDGEIKHSIISYGDDLYGFQRYVVFSCLGRCKVSFESCISDSTYQNCVDSFLTVSSNLIGYLY